LRGGPKGSIRFNVYDNHISDFNALKRVGEEPNNLVWGFYGFGQTSKGYDSGKTLVVKGNTAKVSLDELNTIIKMGGLTGLIPYWMVYMDYQSFKNGSLMIVA